MTIVLLLSYVLQAIKYRRAFQFLRFKLSNDLFSGKQENDGQGKWGELLAIS